MLLGGSDTCYTSLHARPTNGNISYIYFTNVVMYVITIDNVTLLIILLVSGIYCSLPKQADIFVCVVYLIDICSYLLAHLSLPLASPDLVMSVSQSEPREIWLLKINQSEPKIGHRVSPVGSQHSKKKEKKRKRK